VTLFLSRIVLDPRSRAVRRDLADCAAMHTTVMSAFPKNDGPARAAFGVLHRVDPHPRGGPSALLVQSRVEPDWSRLPAPDYALRLPGQENPSVKPIDAAYDAIVAGDVLRFRLRANPTRRLDARRVSSETDHLAGKRVALLTDDERLTWLRRKAETVGIDLLAVRQAPDVLDVLVAPGGVVTGRRPGSARGLAFAAVRFDGHLRVTDPAALRRAIEDGIGPAKAYGFGLLSVAPTGAGAAEGVVP